MKQTLLVSIAALALAACVTLKIHPVSFNATVPNLGLSENDRLPLNVAVVVPDPMNTRYYYTPPGMAAGGARRMDQTDQMQGDKGLPISGELARLVDQTFPAAFQHAAVLRQLPPPGQYDAVIELSVVSMDQIVTMKGMGFGGIDNDLWMDWKISILGKGNVELFSDHRSTPKKTFNLSGSFSAEPMIQALGQNGGELIAWITHDAALTAHSELSKSAKR